MQSEDYERMLQQSAAQGQLGQAAIAAQQQSIMQEQEKGLAEEQLDVEAIVERIYNLLKGKVYDPDKKEWIAPAVSMQTLSEWGVQRIMQTVRFHINKNTLLSNYDAEQINKRMFRFVTEINDLVLLKYEILFVQPTFEDCKQILEAKIQDRVKLRQYALEILGEKKSEVEVKKEVVKEIENRIEYEMEKIRNDFRKEKLKEYGLLVEEIESQVLSTYNRAYMGKERETLRRHQTFSEIRSLSPEVERKGGMFGWLGRK